MSPCELSAFAVKSVNSPAHCSLQCYPCMAKKQSPWISCQHKDRLRPRFACSRLTIEQCAVGSHVLSREVFAYNAVAVQSIRRLSPLTSMSVDFSTGSVAFTIMAIFTFTQLPAMVSDAILLFLGTLTSGLSTSISMSKAPMAPSSLDSISRLEALDACATLPVLSSAGTAAGP